MFTGIIEEIGAVRSIRTQGEAMVLTIDAAKVLEDVQLGDSIAVNGVCLTVTAHDRRSFSADVMPETFRSTSLSVLKPGSPVNLERAMRADGRFGGHIVQGHVDGTGTIVGRQADANAVVFTIRPNRDGLMRYVIPKGSITIDGISLTVVKTQSAGFTVSIIPHTLEQTVLRHKREGDPVNLECDVLGRYVEHFLKLGPAPDGHDGQAEGLTLETLARYGFD